jgi:hypothetical protein
MQSPSLHPSFRFQRILFLFGRRVFKNSYSLDSSLVVEEERQDRRQTLVKYICLIFTLLERFALTITYLTLFLSQSVPFSLISFPSSLGSKNSCSKQHTVRCLGLFPNTLFKYSHVVFHEHAHRQKNPNGQDIRDFMRGFIVPVLT